ncbi:hypothetical protein V2J09_018335 [Rumex salicifolius]
MGKMHLYNAWLPPPVADETKKEAEAFAGVVNSVRESYRSGDPDSVYSTMKWISVIDLFIKAKSEVHVDDVAAIVEIGLEIFHVSCDKLYAQVRWGSILVKVINKYKRKLSLTVHWRPLYDTLVRTHFKRNIGPEGWRIKHRHFETITSLVRSCRRFFPTGSAHEIWSEFSALLENPWHNSCFEGVGFLRLFLPTNTNNVEFFSQDWVEKCLEIWNSIPNCPFWNSQWTAVLARITKNCHLIVWEPLLPVLFTAYLNLFEVPVANGSGSYPFPTNVPRNTRFLFSNKTSTPSKAIAKSIVYLLRPDSSTQEHFEKLINLLEQYYHPSNGGRWTHYLERFLLYLVIMFQSRLQDEQQNICNSEQEKLFLGRAERRAFVNAVLKLIDRGQYSKNSNLAETVATATSILSYVEPSLVLPFVASRFHMALETMTATHQLKTAVMSVAFAGRSLFFASLSAKSDVVADAGSYIDLLMISLSNALLGMDANDPPKTLATMQLIGSIFSSMASLEDSMEDLSPFNTICFSEWLDEFLCRLFSLLQHLEPSNVVNEGLQSTTTSGTFLVEDGPYYFCMLEILLGRLSKSLYSQALRKISKFVKTNILPGAIAEVGLLCSACVYSNPEEAVVHLVEPILSSVMSSLKGAPSRGFGVRGTFDASTANKEKMSLSPALETAINYQLKVLSVAISFGGPSLLRCRDQLKEVLFLAFESPSWKVNTGGDHLFRSLLGSLVHYYPLDQYRCISQHPDALFLEKWFSTKDYLVDQSPVGPQWHVSSKEEVAFANELLSLHFQSALDELMRICQDKIHTDAGMEKDHLKVTLLRIDSSLQGVSSCLPDFSPSFMNRKLDDSVSTLFLVAGATGSMVGSVGFRERAADVIHAANEYLLKEKSDDSILLILVIRIMDALINYGNIEYEEWSSHKQSWKFDSAAIVEPSINFITGSHSKGKRRPSWALIDKAYMHNTWRSSQSSFHLYRTSGDVSPSNHAVYLVDDLLQLALHRYDIVRSYAARSVLKMMKRWPSIVSRCLLKLTENLSDSSAPEYAVLGSCTILSTQTVLKRLTTDAKAFNSFILGILNSSHHESLKAQKAVTELFVKFNIHFTGVSSSIFKQSNSGGQGFADLISQISSMSFDTDGLHWRYNLMANRVLLLLVMASRSYPHSSPQYIYETAGHFLKNLRSQLPQARILAISALNTLLKESPYKVPNETVTVSSSHLAQYSKPSLEGVLNEIFQEEGFFNETFNSLSHVHIVSDADSTSSRRNQGNSLQSVEDKSITLFYFDFTASWPRTPSWMTLFGGTDTFYSNFARIFKRLVQECGMPAVLALKSALHEFSSAGERSKRCVAAEAFAGVLHSDVDGLSEAWESWMMAQLQNIILAPSVESVPEWLCCVRYAVTGKGKYGRRVPLLREKIIDCLLTQLPHAVTTTIVAKRYAFLAHAFSEVSPVNMLEPEVTLHKRLLKELLLNMSHSSPQVREAVGFTLCVVCSNIQLFTTFGRSHQDDVQKYDFTDDPDRKGWSVFLSEQSAERAAKILNTIQSNDMEVQGDTESENGITIDSQEDARWMETLFQFIIASMVSGRSSYLAAPIVGLLYPVISLQETSNKDLSTLAKAAFELLKWYIFREPHLQKVVTVVLSAADDSNWRTRSAALTFLRTFMYRHTFILSLEEKKKIWAKVERLLTDNQIEVREHAAGVLAGLMKGGDENLATEFRNRTFKEANHIWKKRKQSKASGSYSLSNIHGAALALTSCVLSDPYDMPSWLPEHVTLLARFVAEPTPVKSTVTKAIAEFRRTHADTWNIQKDQFTEDQLEVLADTSSSSSYFA